MGAKILIVDDDNGFRGSIKTILISEGYSVAETTSALKALPILEKHKIDLLITDIVMPEMDGLEFIQQVQKKYPDLKAIGMSGGGWMGNADQVQGLANEFFSGFLKKPFGSKKIIDMVKDIISKTE
ncbi:MAG: hypothetical protein COA79_15115 [Planctomycetota bacterium]|nr:MAG: hypothetical protein COA79_15115 [Planctomycetota bacterium]